MRGKGIQKCNCWVAVGITPAYAGKSGWYVSYAAEPGDHPRVCGEKANAKPERHAVLGSPPRMRGKVDAATLTLKARGITPAYAGKRPTGTIIICPTRDHPRVCGEKAYKSVIAGSLWGSPPRMRGKAGGMYHTRQSRGITPAYAGKRRTQNRKDTPCWDHPRVCGEKWMPQP